MRCHAALLVGEARCDTFCVDHRKRREASVALHVGTSIIKGNLASDEQTRALYVSDMDTTTDPDLSNLSQAEARGPCFLTSEKVLCPKRRPYELVRKCPYGAPECPGRCSLYGHTICQTPFHVLHLVHTKINNVLIT